MNEFRFAHPEWIHATWIVLALATLLVFLELRSRTVVDRLLSRSMQTRLVHRTSLGRRFSVIALLTASMILLVFALMRPQWGRTVQEAVRVDSQIMICLDVSKSMLAEDVAPNRLERAKVELDSLLGLMRDDQQVGLIAFAGKATVLCPMTTDFGFLRLVLAEAEPPSVGLGGTKIGEAIAKAVDGFRTAGDIQRLILLITDGEDHDSYPLQAAERAREKGVRIVSIGFGDEAGSKIEITDPRTGVRSFLKDREGAEVTSRLDGQTLRDIALMTQGAYVPAGTGALDLESIYRAHLAPLLQGSLESQRRVVRNEIYQWFVLAAVLLFLLALTAAAPWNLKARVWLASQALLPPGPTRTAACVTLLLLPTATAVTAQAPPPTAPPATTSSEAAQPDDATTYPAPAAGTSDTSQSPPNDAIDLTLPPRTLYNSALAWLDNDLDRAEEYLNAARGQAAEDGELRFRALYNLGWVEIHRADQALENEPEKALQHLHQAANRFRESIRVRPDNPAARQNLEIISRRILELTDTLRQQQSRDLAARLDELIEQTRSQQSALQHIVERVGAETTTTSAEGERAEFRRLAAEQRQLISEVQQFASDAGTELDALRAKPEEERKPEEQLRAAQIQNMLSRLESGIQRMNRARSLTRRLQAPQSFHRWATALSDLKRARDQLRHPVEVLGQILADAREMVQLSALLAAGKATLTGDDAAPITPPWLTSDFIADLLTATRERTAELEQVFSSITASAQNQLDQQQEQPGAQPADPATQQLLRNIETATPLVTTAREQFDAAHGELDQGTIAASDQYQREAVATLLRAWEQFLDIRRLIELIHENQRLVQRALQETADQPQTALQIAGPLEKALATNEARCERLEKLIRMEQEQLPPASPSEAGTSAPAAPPPAGSPGQDTGENDEAVELQRQRLELAATLLPQVVAHTQEARRVLQAAADAPATSDQPAPTTALEPPPTDDAAPTTEAPVEPTNDATIDRPAPTPEQPDSGTEISPEPPQPMKQVGPLDGATAAVERSLTTLEELRRLFFSLVEHLRDTAQRQADLADDTNELAADAEKRGEKSSPLALRQEQLQQMAQQIGQTLRGQSEQAAAAPPPPSADAASPDQNGVAQDTAAAETLREASELVLAAKDSMGSAVEQLRQIAADAENADDAYRQVQQSQAEALRKLLDALARLQQNDSPQEDPQQQSEQPQDDQQQQQQQQQQMNSQQLLQLIRDQEAERRKDKNRQPAGAAGVEKDW